MFIGQSLYIIYCFFFFNDTATTEIYTLSLHDALPISSRWRSIMWCRGERTGRLPGTPSRSEEHTSELQSQSNLVCRLLLEKKKQRWIAISTVRLKYSERERYASLSDVSRCGEHRHSRC